MIVGIGIDITELYRIAKSIEQPRFLERILTERERELASALAGKRKVEFVAGRFAAKEAFSKAIGTGIGKEVGFQDIEIINDERGKPIVHASYPYVIHISISHSNDYAIAQVILEGMD